MIEFPTLHVHGTREGHFAIGENNLKKDGADYVTEPRDVQEIPFELVAYATQAQPEFQGVDGIRLAACYSAATGLAARFARHLQTQIFAPTHAPIIVQAGLPQLLCFFPGDLADGAAWILFGPAGDVRSIVFPDLQQNAAVWAAATTTLDLHDSHEDDAAKAFWQAFTSNTTLHPDFIAGHPIMHYNRFPLATDA